MGACSEGTTLLERIAFAISASMLQVVLVAAVVAELPFPLAPVGFDGDVLTEMLGFNGPACV
jgi:hypothetical protein